MSSEANGPPNQSGGNHRGWSAGDAIALASAFIALCALGLAVYEGRENRLHQRLSVQPYVSFNFFYDSAGAYFAFDNWGLGPATIYWFRASVDGKTQNSWREVLRAIGMSENVNFRQSIPAPGVMMPPSSINQSVNILAVDGNVEKEKLIGNYMRIKLEACYCSLYRECWIASTETSSPLHTRSCNPTPPESFQWER